MKYLNDLKNLPKVLFLIALFVCASILNVDAQKEEKKYIRTTEKGVDYEVIGWETDVVYNPHAYTWFAWEEPIIKKVKTQKVKMVPVSEFDRPPIFGSECLTVEDQFACSNNQLQEYVADNFLDYPDPALRKNQEGLEYVTFTLDKDGNFEGNLKVVSKKDPCQGCSEAAIDIVNNMEDMWFPAIKDGKTVKTQLTIPVKFNLIDIN